jgi:hypothetical protein
MKEDEALGVALTVLTFIAAEENALSRLMNETGLEAARLRDGAADPELLGAVLDFLFADETLLLDFCRAKGVAPGQVIKARAVLPGGPAEWM